MMVNRKNGISRYKANSFFRVVLFFLLSTVFFSLYSYADEQVYPREMAQNGLIDYKPYDIELKGDVTITGVLEAIFGSQKPNRMDEDGILYIIVPPESSISDITNLMPQFACAKLSYPEDMESGGFSEEAMFRMEWSLSGLAEELSKEGDVLATGRWGECLDNVTGGNINVQDYPPQCRIIITETEAISLPEAVYFHKVEWNQGASRRIVVNKNQRQITIVFGPDDFEDGAELKLGVTDRDTGDEVKLTSGDYYIHYYEPTLYFVRLNGFFKDEKIYDVVLNKVLNGNVYPSNPMMLNVKKEAGLGNEIPPPPAVRPPEDDGLNVVPRDGSGRNTQEKGQDTKVFSMRSLETLLKSGKDNSTVIMGDIRITLPKELLEALAKEKQEITLKAEVKDEKSLDISVKKGNKAVKKLSSPITVRWKLNQENSLLKGLSKKDREEKLVVEMNGKVISTSYFDSKSEEMVIVVNEPGKYKLKKGNSVKFKDIKGHWSEALVNFASSRDIAKGYEDGSFKPNKSITEKEFILFMERNLPEGFTSEAKRKSEKLQNSSEVTRLDAAMLIYSIKGGEAIKSDETNKLKETNKADVKNGFTDVKGLKAAEQKAIHWIYKEGLMEGRSGGSFAPDRTLTRSEALKILVNILKNE